MEEKQKLEQYEIPPDVIDNILVELLYKNGVINKKTYENYKKKFVQNVNKRIHTT